MILGNSVNGVALAAERLDAELRAGRDLIELRLALGATSRQAAHDALRGRPARGCADDPQHEIAGIVAIPGMMTGQLLAGADVRGGLRYQILIYFLMAGHHRDQRPTLLLSLRLAAISPRAPTPWCRRGRTGGYVNLSCRRFSRLRAGRARE